MLTANHVQRQVDAHASAICLQDYILIISSEAEVFV